MARDAYVAEKLTPILEEMVAAVLKEMPDDPKTFMRKWLAEKGQAGGAPAAPAAAEEVQSAARKSVAALGALVAGPSMEVLWPVYESKMKAEGLNDAAIAAFKYNYEVLVSGADTMIPEASIGSVSGLDTLESLTITPNPELLSKTVMLKLNGGLGTGMGLDKAKSLLEVSNGNSFLDLIAKQVSSMKTQFGQDVAFMVMNSFSTSADTKAALDKYDHLPKGDDLEFVQNKAPKVTESDLTPADWAAERGHEWCPPGHGDLYPAMLGSGTLDKLLSKGFKYMFVSNSDNWVQ